MTEDQQQEVLASPNRIIDVLMQTGGPRTPEFDAKLRRVCDCIEQVLLDAPK